MGRERQSTRGFIAALAIMATAVAACGDDDEDAVDTTAAAAATAAPASTAAPAATAAPDSAAPSTDATDQTGTDAAQTTTGGGESSDAEIQAWFEEVRTEHEGETVTMLMASHPGTTGFQETVSRFEEGTGVNVEFDVSEEGAMIGKLITECGVQGDIYDIYMMSAEGVAGMSQAECAAPISDHIATLPEWYDYEDLEPAYRELFDVNGTAYAIPFAGESVFLMYRKDLFEEHGREVPQTWDELRDTAKFFTENVDGVAGVSFRARQGWEFTYQFSAFLFPFGGQLVDPTTAADCPTATGCAPAIDVPGSVEALEYMISLKDYAPTGVESFSFPEAWQAFQNGDSAMLVEATAAASEVEDPEKSTVAGNVGYAVLPEGPAGAYTGVWGWGLSLNNHSTKKDAALAVITWLTSKANSEAYVDAGGVPSRTSDFADPENQATYPYYEAIGAALEQAADLAETGNAVAPKTPMWSAWSEAIGTIGSEAFTGQIEPADAIEQMQAEMERVSEG